MEGRQKGRRWEVREREGEIKVRMSTCMTRWGRSREI